MTTTQIYCRTTKLRGHGLSAAAIYDNAANHWSLDSAITLVGSSGVTTSSPKGTVFGLQRARGVAATNELLRWLPVHSVPSVTFALAHNGTKFATYNEGGQTINRDDVDSIYHDGTVAASFKPNTALTFSSLALPCAWTATVCQINQLVPVEMNIFSLIDNLVTTKLTTIL